MASWPKTWSAGSTFRRGPIRQWMAMPLGARTCEVPRRRARCGYGSSSTFRLATSPPGRSDPVSAPEIFTGAPLPEGADSVIRQEDTDEGAVTVAIVRDRDVGREHPSDRRRHRQRKHGPHRRYRAGAGAARCAGLARGCPSAGLPPTAGGHPRQRRRDRGRGPAGGDPERPQDREQQHPHAGGAGATRGWRAGQPGNRGRHARQPADPPEPSNGL